MSCELCNGKFNLNWAKVDGESIILCKTCSDDTGFKPPPPPPPTMDDRRRKYVRNNCKHFVSESSSTRSIICNAYSGEFVDYLQCDIGPMSIESCKKFEERKPGK